MSGKEKITNKIEEHRRHLEDYVEYAKTNLSTRLGIMSKHALEYKQRLADGNELS